MSTQDPARGPPLPAEPFTAWADRALPELGAGPLRQRPMPGGSNSQVIRIERGGEAMMLRRPRPSPSPYDLQRIAREARVLAALTPTPVAAPDFRAYCDDPQVIGAPFLVMRAMEGFPGFPFETLPAPYHRPGPARRQLAAAQIDALAALARLDHRRIGLADLDSTEDFLQHEIELWTARLAASPPRSQTASFAYVADWLREACPPMSPPGLLHGDVSFGNCLFQPFDPGWAEPARLAALVDWELAGLGDPLLDLGLALFPFRGADEPEPPVGYFDPAEFPCREELAERWAEGSGRPVRNLVFYMVLMQFKLAVAIERHTPKGDEADVGETYAPRLIAKAEAMARRVG